MKAQGKTVHEILISLPEDRAEPFNKLHDVIVKIFPKVFEPAINMEDWDTLSRTASTLPAIIVNQSEPLPFAGIASQKGSINFYHVEFTLMKNY